LSNASWYFRDLKVRKIILRKEKLKKEEREKKEEPVEVRKIERKKLLREVMVKIGLERIDTQKGIIVEVLLDSCTTKLVMSSEFAKKTGV